MVSDRPFPLQQQWIGLDSKQRPKLGNHWRNLAFALVPVALIAVAFGMASKPAEVAPVQHSDPPAAKRGDRLVTPTRVVTVRTIPIVQAAPEPQPLPPQAAPPALVETVAAEERPPRKRSVNGGDICRRHGLRKVLTNGGRSWRCRK